MISFSSHCNSDTGHFRMGKLIFIWRNSCGQNGLGSHRNEWGEFYFELGSRNFHFF